VENTLIVPKKMILRKSLMTCDYFAGLAVGLTGVAMAMFRTKNGEQNLLIGLLNPGELVALFRISIVVLLLLLVIAIPHLHMSTCCKR